MTLRRRTPLRRGGPLKSSGPPKRKTRVKAVNAKRAKKKYERNFGAHGDWIRLQCCVCCGAGPLDSDGGQITQAAHVDGRRGMGGAGADKRALAPLCWRCHQIEEGGREIFGCVSFMPAETIEALRTAAWVAGKGAILSGGRIRLDAVAAMCWFVSPDNPENS